MTASTPDDPILRTLEMARFSLSGSWPAPTFNTRLVCLDSTRRVYPIESLPTHGERLFHSFTVYEIDTGEHSLLLNTTLPCAEEAFSFRAVVSLTWSVRDPVVVARRNIRDARAVYWPFLTNLLRPLGRQHSVEHSAAAEDALNEALSAAPFPLDKPEDTGLAVVRASVQLTLDGGAEKHVAMRTEVKRRAERERIAQDERLETEKHRLELDVLRGQLDTTRDQLDHERKLAGAKRSEQQSAQADELAKARAERDAERQRWKADQDIAEATMAHRLVELQAKHRRELAAQEAESQRKLAKLTVDNDITIKQKQMAFYREALEQGNYGLIILQLAQSPNDVAGVIDLIQRHQEISFQNSRDIVQAFLDAGRANAADVHPAWQKALASLLESLQAPVASIGRLRSPGGEPVPGISTTAEAEAPPDIVTAEVVPEPAAVPAGGTGDDDEDE